MKRLTLMLGLVGILSTIMDAKSYSPQQGEQKAKSKTVKVDKPVKKIRIYPGPGVKVESRMK